MSQKLEVGDRVLVHEVFVRELGLSPEGSRGRVTASPAPDVPGDLYSGEGVVLVLWDDGHQGRAFVAMLEREDA